MTATIIRFPEARIVRDPKTVTDNINLDRAFELKLKFSDRAERLNALKDAMTAAEPGEYHGSGLGATVALVLAAREDYPSPVHWINEYLLAAKFDSGQGALLVTRGSSDSIGSALQDIDQALEEDEEAMDPEAGSQEPFRAGQTRTLYDDYCSEAGEMILFAEFDYPSLATWSRRHGWRLADHMAEIEAFFELVPAD